MRSLYEPTLGRVAVLHTFIVPSSFSLSLVAATGSWVRPATQGAPALTYLHSRLVVYSRPQYATPVSRLYTFMGCTPAVAGI